MNNIFMNTIIPRDNKNKKTFLTRFYLHSNGKPDREFDKLSPGER